MGMAQLLVRQTCFSGPCRLFKAKGAAANNPPKIKWLTFIIKFFEAVLLLTFISTTLFSTWFPIRLNFFGKLEQDDWPFPSP